MLTVSFPQLVKQITSKDLFESASARRYLLSMEEDAINPLVDEYYAGVTEEQGVAILDIIARIGGPDAMVVLRNIFNFEEKRQSIKLAAALGLLRNRIGLSRNELEDVMLFFIGEQSR